MKKRSSNQYFGHFLYYLRLKYLKHFGRPVLIWNMGKVASTSIARSLWSTLGRHNILTTHFMNKDDNYRSKMIYSAFFKDTDVPLPIITLTREPISKNISSFFQNFERNVGVPFEQYKSSTNELCSYFVNSFDKHDTTINWFDDNIKKHIGLDVYSHPFKPSKGYCIIKHGRYNVLFLRSEENDNVKEQAVKELLNLSEFSLKNENVGANKPYSKKYKEFQKTLNLKGSYLDRMLNSRYTQHFYSSSEIDDIREKWKPTTTNKSG